MTRWSPLPPPLPRRYDATAFLRRICSPRKPCSPRRRATARSRCSPAAPRPWWTARWPRLALWTGGCSTRRCSPSSFIACKIDAMRFSCSCFSLLLFWDSRGFRQRWKPLSQFYPARVFSFLPFVPVLRPLCFVWFGSSICVIQVSSCCLEEGRAGTF